MHPTADQLRAGAAVTRLGPDDVGSPSHAARGGSGGAIYLSDGLTELLLLPAGGSTLDAAADDGTRDRIADVTSIGASNVVLAAGRDCDRRGGGWTFPGHDRVAADRALVAAAAEACRGSQPARIGFERLGLREPGTLREVPAGLADPNVGLLAVRSGDEGKYIAVLLIVTPCRGAATRGEPGGFDDCVCRYLQEQVIGLDCPVFLLRGPAGQPSADSTGDAASLPTPPADEHDRLAMLVAHAAEQALANLGCQDNVRLRCRTAATGGNVALPLSVLEIGPWRLVGWPSGVAADCAAALRARTATDAVFTLANRLPDGYIVTSQTPVGRLLIDETARLLA